jgi:hypothetical protein
LPWYSETVNVCAVVVSVSGAVRKKYAGVAAPDARLPSGIAAG